MNSEMKEIKMKCQKVVEKYEVVVVGGGMAGIAAAIAAAREGINVLLIEKNGFLGGMATAALVNPFMPYWRQLDQTTKDYSTPVCRGIFETIIEQLEKLGGLHKNRQTFNEEILKIVLDRMMQEYNIKVLFHTSLIGCDQEDGTIKSIYYANKSGISQCKARYYVDTTGDADLSAMAGCEYQVGTDQDHACQPMTLCARIGNVDFTKFEPSDGDLFKEIQINRKEVTDFINKKYRQHKDLGLIHNPREDVLTFPNLIDGVVHFNSTRILNHSSIDGEAFSQAEFEGREQVFELFRFMKENIPGFEKSQLLATAPQIGVRESRRIVGEYTIQADDLMGMHKFHDSIARGNYSIDIHNPKGTGTVLKRIPFGGYYTIPYRALLPKQMKNLIVAGRPISSTHEAHSAYRVMPICTCIGEGAGIASTVAVKDQVDYSSVDIKKVQEKLTQYNGLY